MPKRKAAESIPDEFSSLQEAAEFWDSHDTTHYPDAFRDVGEVVTNLKRRRYEVQIDEDVVKALRAKARRKCVSLSQLANELLRELVVR